MKRNIPTMRASAILFAGLLFAFSAQIKATTVEGFESTTLNASNSIGDASIRTPSYFGINPTQGTHELLLTTISTAGAHDPGPNQSGTNAASVSSVAAFLGVATSSIRDGTATGQEGSAFSINLGALTAGTTVSFNYDFLTNEIQPGAHNDFGFITLTGMGGNTPVIADTFSPLFVTTGVGNPFALETHYQTYSFTIPTNGTFTLGIGIVDATTTDVSSALLVDNIVVPEGGSAVVLLGIALVAVAGLRRALAVTRPSALEW
jgi:hypothetical protein